MATIKVIAPHCQPINTFRLLEWIEQGLEDEQYSSFYMCVAFAKYKPFLKLQSLFEKWKKKKNEINAIFGIDHKGTSYQALEMALNFFDETHIVHANYSTFHPKFYFFIGATKAAFYCGSNNFTVGGLETNFESGILIDQINVLEEPHYLQSALDSYNTILTDIPCVKKLSPLLLKQLNEAGLLVDEISTSRIIQKTNLPSRESVFKRFNSKPARSISKSSLTSNKVDNFLNNKKELLSKVIDGFVIQVVPHHNGEIFLSKTAINQNPSFFGFPFTGKTIPKKDKNISYPQRDPDPVVNIRIYDKDDALIKYEENYNLNTIFYTAKSEIRITITSSISMLIPKFSIMVMRKSNTINCDYELDFYSPNSTNYSEWLNVCDQTLPSGGQNTPRKMGWF